MKKSILILEDSSKSYFGGGQQITLITAEILAKQGFHLYLADFTTHSLFWDKISGIIPSSNRIKLYGNGKSINKNNRSLQRLIEIFKSLFFFPFNFFLILRCLHKEEKDSILLYCTTKKTLLLTFFISFISGIHYIYHSHMVIKFNGLLGKILKMALRKADKIICVSQTTQKNVDLPNTILIYNSLEDDSDVEKEYLPSKKFVVAGVGSLIPIKGFEYLVKSFDELKYKENTEIRIYGQGPLWEELAALEKADHVRMMGFCENMIGEFIEKVDVVVVPSIIEEALPMVLIQALKVGIPCIVTGLGGQAEVVQEGINGFWVPIKDPKAIAEKIDLLQTNHILYLKMCRASKALYKNFSYKLFQEKISVVFKSL